jgi:hypothetical protein
VVSENDFVFSSLVAYWLQLPMGFALRFAPAGLPAFLAPKEFLLFLRFPKRSSTFHKLVGAKMRLGAFLGS